MIGLFEKTKVNDMSFALDTLSVKNNVIARNIANKDTPMYKGTKIVFQEVMAEYFSSGPDKTLPLKRTHARHLPIVGDTLDPRTMVRFQNNPSLSNDGNDVNVDYEMSQQADTSIRYQLFSDLIGRKFSGLKEIIKTR